MNTNHENNPFINTDLGDIESNPSRNLNGSPMERVSKLVAEALLTNLVTSYGDMTYMYNRAEVVYTPIADLNTVVDTLGGTYIGEKYDSLTFDELINLSDESFIRELEGIGMRIGSEIGYRFLPFPTKDFTLRTVCKPADTVVKFLGHEIAVQTEIQDGYLVVDIHFILPKEV